MIFQHWLRQRQAGIRRLIAPLRYRLGLRLYRWNYNKCVVALAKEAQEAAMQDPGNLTVLLGDSITQGFPSELLPTDRTILNQGISGDTSTDLLKRLYALQSIDPETIFLMIGINDLLYDSSSDCVLHNYRQIIHKLQRSHPTTRIVIQSVLPHAHTQATWHERDRLLKVPNQTISQLNQSLILLAKSMKVDYLELFSAFSDQQNNLLINLSTDGLHLNHEGYKVWQMELQLYFQTFANRNVNL